MALEIDQHDNGALIWTWPLTLIVGGLGVVLLGLAAATGWTPPLVLGPVALIVAGGGRLGSAFELRYAETPLARPPTVADPVHHTGVHRRSTVRSSGAPWATVALGGVVVLAGAVAWGGVQDLLFISFGLALIAFGVLVGPVARFVVTPAHLHIDTPFRRTSVPRRLIGEFEHSTLDVRLRLRDGDFVDIRVDSPIMEYTSKGYWMNARCRVRTVERIVRMLREVPARDAGGEVVHRERRAVITGAGLAVIAVLATAATGVLATYGVF